ncbi:hypothetical protein F2P81_017600 [Scophthalmus maximus]|uniref:Uncharacterized protein n=1 Tax=Scophthalmus maximus TaxID=52904 RepID=A0A6A4SEC9_SCOMX|nr:hypothetical protein F2P81_017600 [Scophthalmus maximus]
MSRKSTAPVGSEASARPPGSDSSATRRSGAAPDTSTLRPAWSRSGMETSPRDAPSHRSSRRARHGSDAQEVEDVMEVMLLQTPVRGGSPSRRRCLLSDKKRKKKQLNIVTWRLTENKSVPAAPRPLRLRRQANGSGNAGTSGCVTFKVKRVVNRCCDRG